MLFILSLFIAFRRSGDWGLAPLALRCSSVYCHIDYADVNLRLFFRVRPCSDGFIRGA
jgi:hypothetical protein